MQRLFDEGLRVSEFEVVGAHKNEFGGPIDFLGDHLNYIHH